MSGKPTYEELEQKLKALEKNYEKFEQAEDKFRQQSYFLQELIDSIPNPIFYKNENAAYLGCNKAFESFLGRVSSEIIGKTVYDLAPKEKADKYHEMDVALLNEPGVQIYEYSVVDSEGNHRDVLFNKATINKIDGSLGGLVGIIFDITERKMMEEELQRSKELSETILNAIDDSVCLINTDDFSIVNANSSFLAEYQTTQNAILGRPCYDITHHRQEPCCPPDDKCPLKETVQEVRTAHVEHRHFLPDGSEVFVHIITSPVMDEKGKVIQIVHIARDITDRKKAEREKEKLIKELQTALEEIKTLKGIIPICMHCKGIRDDKGSWNQLEKFITEHSEAQFSHGICEECLKKYYPEEADEL